MAKMFIKMAEAQQELGLDEEGLKQLVREGKLREFRDGGEILYKVDQIDGLKDELGTADPGDTGGGIDLADTGGPIGLQDTGGTSAGASGSSIALADTGRNDSLGLSDTGGMAALSPEDTAADIGLSGSLGGVPSPSSSGSGITVLEDTGSADPMAQTAVGGTSHEQVNLEATGSGSGLLDLTRESDDTSLGADVLDDIGPGGTALGGSSVGGATLGSMGGTGIGGSMGGSALGGSVGGGSVLGGSGSMQGVAATGGATPAGGAVYVEEADGLSIGLAAAALAASLVCLVGLLAVGGLAGRVFPDLLQSFGDGNPALIIGGAGLALAVVFLIVGMVLGKR